MHAEPHLAHAADRHATSVLSFGDTHAPVVDCERRMLSVYVLGTPVTQCIFATLLKSAKEQVHFRNCS